MITEFKLLNEYGQSYALNSLDSGYLTNPSGMGFEMSSSYTLLGNAWVQDYLTDKQVSLTGKIVFYTSDVYKAQSTLLKFIRTSKKLKISRKTSVGEFYKDIDITKYSMSMVEDRALKCSVTMQSRSLWYSNDTTTYTISTDKGESLRYPYKFPATFKGSTNGTIELSNDGSVEAPFTVSFIGEIVNPTLVLKQDEEEVARIVIVGEAAEGESIELSTVDGDLYCYRKKADENVSLVADLDISNNNFFKIPIGSSTITLSADSDITQPVIFTVKKLYRAV